MRDGAGACLPHDATGGALAQRAPARQPAALDAGNTGASRSPRHHFDCVQNSESAPGLQDTVPHRPGRELHPHMRASLRRKEYRRARMRVRRAGCANVAACDAREARCDIGAQGAGRRQTGRGRARRNTARARSGASARGGSVRGRVRPGRARTATGAWREAAGETGGLHGAGRTWPNRGDAASVGECHRKSLPSDLLHVG